MSWLARSIANSLTIDDDGDGENDANNFRRQNHSIASQNEVIDNFDGDLRGVKDDLSEFRESLTRQLWGVANFLAPPPPPHPNHNHQHSSSQLRDQFNDPSVSGDEGDESSTFGGVSIAENDDLKVNLRNCKSNSSLNELGFRNVEDGGGGDDDEEEEGDDDWINEAVGLTDEVLTFAGNIGHHPETWLDFPVEDDEDIEDFPMSEAQKRHAQAVVHLTPRLAALRIELCPAHMSVGFFWKVYFVLLHSRLNKQDAELLSTPEVVEARAKWMQEQQKRAKKESEWYHGGFLFRAGADFDDDGTPRSQQNEHLETLSSWTFASEPATSSTTVDSDVEKQAVSTEPQCMDKSIIDEKPLAETNDKNILPTTISKRPILTFVDDDDDGYDWPEDDFAGQNERLIPVGIEDEISFSDLEDDDCCIPVISKR